MMWLNVLAARFRGLLRRDAVLEEIDDEMRSHVEMLADEYVSRGMSPEEARRAAIASFGNVARARESAFDVRGGGWLDTVWQDVRYGFRGLRRNPGFAAVAVLTLGLGIGANTAVFSVINAVFLQALPYHEPGRLVVVWGGASAPGNFTDMKAQNTVFEDMAAISPRDLSLTSDGEPERLSALRITANLLPLLGVRPALGREFVPEEDRAGGPRAVLLSHGLWQRRYGGAAGVLGRDLRLDGETYSVVGVMPPGFQLVDRRADIFVPMALPPAEQTNRRSHYLFGFARLKPDVPVEQARAEIQALMARIHQQYPDEATSQGADVTALREYVTGESRTPLLVLLVAVGLVLLIACINVGNLLLSRAAVRSREVAVRAALGASRGRVMRQLLLENVPLVACGALVGLLLAYWSLNFLRQLIPPGLAQSVELGLDWRVLGFTLLVAVGATVLFGLVPALQVSKVDLNDALRAGSARAGFSGGGRLQSALVVGEVSLAIALLVGASLLIQTFFTLRGQYAELQGASVVTMKTVLPSSAYDNHARRVAFFDQVIERVRALPGVVSAGYTNALPLDYKGDSTEVTVEGRIPDPGEEIEVNTRPVTADYLRALGVALRDGRHLSDADGPESQPVAIVNEAMARVFWPGEDPVGRRFKVGDPEEETPWLTVAGVAADVRQTGVDAPVKPEIYLPYAQAEYLEVFAPKTLAIRTSGDQSAVVAAVRREIAAIDPNQPVSDVQTMDDVLGHELSGRRLGTLLLGAFAAVALLLASIGIYGVLSHRVRQMTPEIGVRLALGATPSDVLGTVVWRGMRLVLIGAAVGLALALAGTRLMESLLFGVSAADPMTYAGVPVLLAVVALVACYVPARHAASVDPNVALRYE
jgi:putative ABC transport system permease protein